MVQDGCIPSHYLLLVHRSPEGKGLRINPLYYPVPSGHWSGSLVLQPFPSSTSEQGLSILVIQLDRFKSNARLIQPQGLKSNYLVDIPASVGLERD